MVDPSMDEHSWLRKQLEEVDPDLLRGMVSSFIEVLMSAEVDPLRGVGYGERSEARVNKRLGYRLWGLDTRVGTLPVAILNLRWDSYFPDCLLQPRRRAERAVRSGWLDH